jgi:hypothetical protein
MSKSPPRDPHTPPLQITLEIATSSSEISTTQTERNYVIRIDTSEWAPATFAWDQALAADLAALRRADCEPEVLQRLGQRLRQFLRGTDWPRHEAAIIEAHARGAPVHITICSSAHAEELYALPWDLLALDASGQHLAELPGVLVRYAWRRNPTISGDSDDEPGGRILLAWSAAAGEVPAAAHRDALQRACGKHSPVFASKRDVLPHVSWGRLEDALRGAAAHGEPVRALHILCHGAVRGRSFCLAWNDDHSDEPAIVDAGRLRQLLAQYAPHLRLVVLCACDSSNENTLGKQLGSLASSLHRVGIQTVIGSAVPLSSRGSIAFTQSFYRALVVERASVADSFLRARRALASHVRTMDWLALRFYAAPGDDHHDIFLPAPLPRARQRPSRRMSAEQPYVAPRARASLLALLLALIAGVMLAIVLLRYWVPVHPADDVVPPDASVPAPLAAGVPDAALRPPGPQPRPEPEPLAKRTMAPEPPTKRTTEPPPKRSTEQTITSVPSHGFRFEILDCRVIGRIACRIQITNQGEKRQLTLYRKRARSRSELYNQDGVLGLATHAVLDGKPEGAGWISATLDPRESIPLEIEFKNPPSTVRIKRVNLTYHIAELERPVTVSFENIPLGP